MRQPSDLTVGDRVRIAYYDRTEEAVVVEPPTRFGWVKVEQDYNGDPIRYDAAVEFVEKSAS